MLGLLRLWACELGEYLNELSPNGCLRHSTEFEPSSSSTFSDRAESEQSHSWLGLSRLHPCRDEWVERGDEVPLRDVTCCSAILQLLRCLLQGNHVVPHNATVTHGSSGGLGLYDVSIAWYGIGVVVLLLTSYMILDLQMLYPIVPSSACAAVAPAAVGHHAAPMLMS